MIADGHFKEMRDILAHIYTQRVKIKKGVPIAEQEAAAKVAKDGKALAAERKT